MKIVAALAVALLATAAHATPQPPTPTERAPAQTPVTHTVQITDSDLALLNFLASHAGEKCGPAAGEVYCQAQIAADELGKRISAQLQAEAAKKTAP